MSWSDLQNVHFAEPEKLQLLYAAVALFLLSILVWLLKLFIRPKKTHGSRYPFLGTMKFWFSLSAVLILCILAYARPFLPGSHTVVSRGNAEVIFIVDYSASMFLKDTGWARIDVAAREIMKTISGGIVKEGDRAAILIFGKMVSPRLFLTGDLGALSTEADKIGRPENLWNNDLFWGTAIATTFKRIHEVLDRQDMFAEFRKEVSDWHYKPRKNRLVIFISDGNFFNYVDENAGELAQAEKKNLAAELSELRKRNIPVYTVGIGTRSGARLIDILRDYQKNEYDAKLEDELKGQVSRLEPANLEYLSAATGGKSFFIEDFRSDASGFIKASIDRHRSITVEATPDDDNKELWQFFLFGALAVFIIGMKITRF